MMELKNIRIRIFVWVILTLLLSGCASNATLSTEELATVQALAAKKLTQTAQAIPTEEEAVTATIAPTASATLPPPTDTQTSPPPTSTPVHGGGKIAFTSNRDGIPQIYMMDPDGSNQIRLTAHLLESHDPAWSQDGLQLIYVAITGERQSSVRIIDVQNELESVVTNFNVASESPSWAPYDQVVVAADVCVFSCGTDDPTYYSRVFSMNIEGGDQRQLSPGDYRVYRPMVSPDGSRILAEVDNSIVVYRLEDFSRDPLAIPISLGNSQDGAWSPDGNQIAFASYQNDNYDIFITNISTGDITQVTSSPSAERFPSWSPDGQWITFTTNRDGNWEIYVTNLDGSQLSRLTEDPAKDTEPAWSLSQ
ncbi:MAG: hypothetical protein GTO18_02240 [Anaerolineales bacterium]|nr:hypothetical protein [Anaerolineales bacterium]